jgi:CRISPR-associated endonuclease/helicase Cas3
MKECPNCHEQLNWDKINKFFQMYEGHILDSLKILRNYIEINQDVLDQFCERWQLDKESILRSLFVTVYLHDVGKLTVEFQKNIRNGKSSSRYPHAYYALSILNNIELPSLLNVPLEKTAILGHHRQLSNSLYDNFTAFGVPSFLIEEINAFIKKSKKIHGELSFDKWFPFDGLKIQSEELKKPTPLLSRKLRNHVVDETSSFEDKEKIKSVYSYILSLLKTCDDYSSANFSEFISQYNGTITELNSVMEEPAKYVLRPSLENIYERILKGQKPYYYQRDESGGLCGDVPFFGLLFAPCGRGKTETALIWSLKALKKYKRNKIVFAMPTQITSNAMWERFCELFGEGKTKPERIEDGKKQVGLFHGKSFIVLKDNEKNEEENEEDLDYESLEEVKGENFKGNVLFKPVNVTTIDHLVNSFIHGFPQADFAIGNLQNSVVVFDEVHYYEQQTLEHLMTLLELLKKLRIPALLMSGTLPEFFIKKVREMNNEFQVLYSDAEGLLFEPFKIVSSSEPLVAQGQTNEQVIAEIAENYHKNLIQFIILNTIERSKLVYDALKNRLPEAGETIVLHHSQFTYQDRAKKEKNLLQSLKEKKSRPFILVATQVIEISLDISCDIMYTELAPGDALGQRGGRLNRKGRTWMSNGFEHKMKIFIPEELVDEKPRDAPYPISLLKKTNGAIKNGAYSYLELKHLCDYVYSDYELRTPTNLRTVFRKCCLFGFSPYDINFGDEEKGREFQLRNDDEQKLDVIPWDCYKGNETKLNVEHQVAIPLWRYKQDEREYGESRLFMEKYKSGKKKPYLVAKIPYTREKGFDFTASPISPPADNIC